MSKKLKKLFSSIINIDNDNNNNDDEYNLITNIDDLIKGSHLRFKISSKILFSGFYISNQKSLVRDYNIIIVKIDGKIKEIPFYKHKIYQRDIRYIKKKSAFDNKQIRDKYLKNVSVYLNKNKINEEDKLIY